MRSRGKVKEGAMGVDSARAGCRKLDEVFWGFSARVGSFQGLPMRRLADK